MSGHKDRMNRRQVMAGMAAGTLAGLGGCGRYHEFRCRLSVAVHTPEGVRAGAGVFEVVATSNPKSIISPGGGSAEASGEAIAIDLGPRGVLFVLLTMRKSEATVTSLVVAVTKRARLVSDGRLEKPPRYQNLADFTREIAALRGKIEVRPDELPLMVWFRDIADPKTVEAVDPFDLEKSFGDGVRLGAASIEMTRDRVTTGIEKKLPWLAEYRKKMLDGSRGQYLDERANFANSLSTWSFRMGM